MSTAGLMLAFDSIQDIVDVKLPLSFKNSILLATPLHEYFKQLELKYNNNTLLLDMDF